MKRLNDVNVPPDLATGKIDEVLGSVHNAVEPIADLAIKTLSDLKKAIDKVGKAVVRKLKTSSAFVKGRAGREAALERR